MLSLVDTILNNTSLPNLHPALVHFPIAFFPLAIAFDLATLAGRSRSLDRVTAALYAVAALTAWATVWAGEAAEHALTGVPAYLRPEIEAHGEWAERFLYAAAAVALARLALVWWRRGAERVDLLALRGLVLAAALGACLLLVGAADRGGSLVYRSGVAVMAVSVDAAEGRSASGEAPVAPEPAPAEESVATTPAGSAGPP